MVTNRFPSPSKTELFKVSGAGNDFVLLDLISPGATEVFENEIRTKDRSKWAKVLCNRKLGLGADGLIILFDSNDKGAGDRKLFNWDFYNADGSHPKMCGNGIRCTTDFLLRKTKLSSVSIQTEIGIVDGTRDSKGLPCVRFSRPVTKGKEVLFVDGVKYTGHLIDSGVPHFVIEVQDLEFKQKLMPIVKEFRFHKSSGSEGANVTFFVRGSSAIFAAVSFERGVEDFTLACGTGAMAVAEFANSKEFVPRLEVVMPGGSLFVQSNQADTYLSGSVYYSFVGRLFV